MDALIWVLLSLLAFAVISWAAVFLIVRALYRRIRRSRTLNRAVLKSRAQLSRGPQRKVYALHVQLDEALDSGRAAIDVAVRSNGRRGDLPRLFQRIETEAATLRAQLRLMESETDAGALTEQLAAASWAVEQIADMIRELRASVADGLGDPTGAPLSFLHVEVDQEVAALHAGLEELAQLNGGYLRPEPTTNYRSKDRFQTRGVQS